MTGRCRRKFTAKFLSSVITCSLAAAAATGALAGEAANGAKDVAGKEATQLTHHLQASTSTAQRLAALERIHAWAKAQPAYQHGLSEALLAATHAPTPPERELAGASLGLMATAKATGGRDKVVQLLGETDDWPTIRGALASLCTQTEATAFIDFVAALRQNYVLNTGEHHRQRARRALVVCLLTRQAQTEQVSEATFLSLGSAAERGSVKDEAAAALGKAYDLASKGKDGADQALGLITGQAAPEQKAVRLVAANALSATGVIPDDAMIQALTKVALAEPDTEARSEELLALGSFAEVAPPAFAKLKDYLQQTTDCNFAQRLALTLPSHDLRLVLYKKMGKGGRSAALREWLQKRNYQACSGTPAPAQTPAAK